MMYDLIIKNTKIIDGTGSIAFSGDIAIRDSKIVSIGEIKDEANRIIDANGLYTCPGFIDPHCHPDMTLLILPMCHNFIMQGITTAIGGNCGLAQAPKRASTGDNTKKRVDFEGWDSGLKKDLSMADWLKKVSRKGISINYVPFVGHNTIRSYVMGDDFRRHARPEEIEEMKTLVENGMKNGAFGLSTGLDYDPSEYCNTDEIVELTKVAKEYGGIYVSHLRHCQSQWATDDPELYGYGVFHGEIEEAWVGKYLGLMEAFEVGKRANIPVQISHIYTVYLMQQPHPDFLEEATTKATLWLVDKAVEEGVDVSFDVIVSDTTISPINPLINEFLLSRLQKLSWLREYSKEKFINSLSEPKFREKLKKLYREGFMKFGMINTKADPFWMNRFRITDSKNPSYVNKTVGDLSNEYNKHSLELIFDMLIEDPEIKWIQFAEDRAINNKTLPFYLNHPLGMPCTDMTALPPIDFPIENFKKVGVGIPEEFLNAINVPHFYGMFADYIGRFVRDKNALSLENAIQKGTSFVAERFGITERGILKPDYYADILIFDYNTIRMTGDLSNPRQAPEGIEYVIVNGKITYENKKHTGIKAGKVLRKNE